MKELFVPYELVVKFKEKGFDEPCLAIWNKESYGDINLVIVKNYKIEYDYQWYAPIYQQVIDWFREQHNLVLDVFQQFDEVNFKYTGKWQVDISELKNYKDPHIIVVEDVYDDYYDAWNKAIAECLKII